MILALNRLFSLATENNFTDDQEFFLMRMVCPHIKLTIISFIRHSTSCIPVTDQIHNSKCYTMIVWDIAGRAL